MSRPAPSNLRYIHGRDHLSKRNGFSTSTSNSKALFEILKATYIADQETNGNYVRKKNTTSEHNPALDITDHGTLRPSSKRAQSSMHNTLSLPASLRHVQLSHQSPDDSFPLLYMETAEYNNDGASLQPPKARRSRSKLDSRDMNPTMSVGAHMRPDTIQQQLSTATTGEHPPAGSRDQIHNNHEADRRNLPARTHAPGNALLAMGTTAHAHVTTQRGL